MALRAEIFFEAVTKIVDITHEISFDAPVSGTSEAVSALSGKTPHDEVGQSGGMLVPGLITFATTVRHLFGLRESVLIGVQEVVDVVWVVAASFPLEGDLTNLSGTHGFDGGIFGPSGESVVETLDRGVDCRGRVASLSVTDSTYRAGVPTS